MKLPTHFTATALFLSLVAFLSVRDLCSAQETATSQSAGLPGKRDFHVFLLAGQSNMAGRGDVGPGDLESHPRVFALDKSGEWVLAKDPIHFDKPFAGVGPGRTFGIQVAEAQPEITVGLVPSACGGSSIDQWQPGIFFEQTQSHPYDDALKRAGLAMEKGILKAVLWHQGESDSVEGKSSEYEAKLRRLIARFRKDLGVPDLPFFIGQLGQFESGVWNESKGRVDQAHRNIAATMAHVYFVPSDGLTCKADGIHFNSKSMREFGQRYARSYLAFVEKTID